MTDFIRFGANNISKCCCKFLISWKLEECGDLAYALQGICMSTHCVPVFTFCHNLSLVWNQNCVYIQYTGRSNSISKGSISTALSAPKFPKKHVCYFAWKCFKMNPMEKEYNYKLKPCILLHTCHHEYSLVPRLCTNINALVKHVHDAFLK